MKTVRAGTCGDIRENKMVDNINSRFTVKAFRQRQSSAEVMEILLLCHNIVQWGFGKILTSDHAQWSSQCCVPAQ